MTKKILSILIFLGIFLSSISPARSQTSTQIDFDYNRAYADYVYNTQLYNDAYSAYQLARSQYLASHTLVAQNNAREATLKMLQARDEMIKTYLTAIRLRVKETSGISANDLNTVFAQIDNDFVWWSNHKTKLPSAGSLDDLVADSDEAYAHYPATLMLVYQSLSTIFIGRLDSDRSDLSRSIADLKNKVAQIKANGDKDTSQIERSLIDVDNSVSRSATKQSEAKNILNTLSLEKSSGSNDDKFAEIKTKLKESLAYMNEAVNLINQIIIEIKTQ